MSETSQRFQSGTISVNKLWLLDHFKNPCEVTFPIVSEVVEEICVQHRIDPTDVDLVHTVKNTQSTVQYHKGQVSKFKGGRLKKDTSRSLLDLSIK